MPVLRTIFSIRFGNCLLICYLSSVLRNTVYLVSNQSQTYDKYGCPGFIGHGGPPHREECSTDGLRYANRSPRGKGGIN